jgi:hypothetical protein
MKSDQVVHRFRSVPADERCYVRRTGACDCSHERWSSLERPLLGCRSPPVPPRCSTRSRSGTCCFPGSSFSVAYSLSCFVVRIAGSSRASRRAGGLLSPEVNAVSVVDPIERKRAGRSQGKRADRLPGSLRNERVRGNGTGLRFLCRFHWTGFAKPFATDRRSSRRRPKVALRQGPAIFRARNRARGRLNRDRLTGGEGSQMGGQRVVTSKR